MPLYEYACDSCNQVHEIIQQFSDEPVKECPTCQGPVHKIMSRSSFALKGTGWYTTDYKRSSGPKPCEANGAAKPASAPCCSGGSCPH